MALKTRAALKTLFGSDKMPTGTDFSDLIDSLYNKTDDDLTVTGLEPHDVTRTYDTGETCTYLGVLWAAIKDGVLGAFNVLNFEKIIVNELFFKMAIWDNATAYGTGSLVTREAKGYVSNTDGNTGNDPKTDAINWTEVNLNNNSFGNEWVTNTVYDVDDYVRHAVTKKLYKCVNGTSLLSLNLDTEIAAGGKWSEAGIGKHVHTGALKGNVAITSATLGDEMVIPGNLKAAIDTDGKVYIDGSTANDGERNAPITYYDGGLDKTTIIFDANLVDATNDGNVLLGYNDTAISAADAATKKFTITGNHAANLSVDERIVVAGSTANDGVYTVVSATDVGGNTEVIVVEALGDNTGDGTLTYFDSSVAVSVASQLDGLIEVPGTLVTDYGMAIGDTLNVLGSTGNNGSLVITEVIELTTTTLIRGTEIVDNTDDGNVDYPIKINITHNLHNQYNNIAIYDPSGVFSSTIPKYVEATDSTTIKVNVIRENVVVTGNYQFLIQG